MISARVTYLNDNLHAETSSGLTASGSVINIIDFLISSDVDDVTMPDWRESDAPTGGQKIAIYKALREANTKIF